MDAVTETDGPALRELGALKTMFRDSADNQSASRRLAFRDRDWYDNADDDQWTEAEKAELKSRGQPPVTANDIKDNVNFLLGHEQRTRTDPRAYPNGPDGEKAAEIATHVLDFCENRTRFDKTASRCFKDMTIEGIECAEVTIERGDEICINRIAFEKFFYDPRSREEDFSDARWLGYVDWFDRDEAVELFPDSEEKIHHTLDSAEQDEGFEDKPTSWGDPTRKRVKIAVIYYKVGAEEWAYAYYTGGGILREGPSPYVDDKGRTSCPLIAQSVYVDRDNNRYGIVRDMISVQREKNWSRSIMLYLLKARRLWASDPSTFPDPDDAKKQIARADGLLIARGEMGKDWGILDNQAEAAGHMQRMQMAQSDMDRAGPNRAMAEGSRATSGRDRALQQNAGLTEENNIFDAHLDWKLRVYRAIWARAKQYWTAEKYVRVSKDDKAFEFIRVNQPVYAEIYGQKMQVGVENRLAEMDVDISIEAVQDALSLQHEQFEVFVQALPVLINAPPQYTEMLIDMMPNLHNKDRLRSMVEEAKQVAAQMGQVQQQLAMKKAMQDIEKGQADIAKTQSETAENWSDIEVNRFKAIAERIENELRMKAAQAVPEARVHA